MQGIILEGYRRNFLPPADRISRVIRAAGAEFREVAATRLGPPGWEICLPRRKSLTLSFPTVPTEQTTDFTASVYAWADSHSPNVQVTLALATGEERVQLKAILTEKPERLILPIRFSECPASVDVSLRISSSAGFDSLVTLSMPCVEEGLFPTTAISPDEERDFETLSYPRGSKMFADTEGTASFLFEPSWNGHELTKGKPPHFLSCSSDDGLNAVDIFSDPLAGGLVKARLIADGIESTISSTLVPQKGVVHFVALRWAGGFADLFVDGFASGAIPARFPDPGKLGKQFYVGTSARHHRLSCFSVIAHVRGYQRWVDDNLLRIEAYRSYPSRFDIFRHLAQLFHYRSDHWPTSLVRPLLFYPRQWQETPPVWLNDAERLAESVFRDEVKRALSVSVTNVYPEVPSGDGRTDLLVPSGEGRPSLRIEFKIWGRNDYAEIPQKPLRYFVSGDYFGIVMMLNPNKHKNIGSDYRAKVRASNTRIRELIDVPFGVGGDLADHFVSIHESDRGTFAEILHVVVDLHGPFANLVQHQRP